MTTGELELATMSAETLRTSEGRWISTERAQQEKVFVLVRCHSFGSIDVR
jgi:hypothetical protein